MRLKTILLGGLGVVVVAIAGVVIVVATTDFGKYKGVVVDKVEQATGRKLSIAGDVHLTLLPAPALSVKDVAFANADWAAKRPMVKLGELAAQVEVLPLVFGGNLRVDRLVLKDVDVQLETDEKGRGNWEFGAPAAATAPPAGPAPKGQSALDLPSFADVLLENIALTYRDGRTRQTTTVAFERLAASGPPGAPMKVKAALSYEKLPIEVNATVGALATLFAPGQRYPVEAEIAVAGATLKLIGSAAEPLAGRGLAFDVTLDGKSLAALGEIAGTTLPAKPYHLAAAIAGDADGVITLKSLQGSLGASSLAGEASIAVAGARPKLAATLTAPMIDLTELPPGKAAPPPHRGDDGRVFSKDPLPLEALRALDADLTLNAAQVKTTSLALQNVAFHVTLDDRDLRASPFSLDLADSHFAGRAQISARQAPATLVVDITGKPLDLGKLIVATSGNDILDGKGDVAVALRGSGDSIRAIMASLDGSASLAVGRGVIKSRYADLIGADLFREAFAWTQGKKAAKLSCMVARFEIHKGLATSRGLLLDTEDVTILGEGTVDLGAERLDLELKPAPKERSLLNLAMPLDIGGTFQHPTVLPNKVAVAKEVAVGVATVINPLIALAPLLLDGGGDKNACLAALESGKLGAGKPGAPPSGAAAKSGAPQAGTAAKKPEGGIGGAVKGIGRSLDSLFK
jgi:uncharacterized protein involved in outer membrane biogenesis